MWLEIRLLKLLLIPEVNVLKGGLALPMPVLYMYIYNVEIMGMKGNDDHKFKRYFLIGLSDFNYIFTANKSFRKWQI